MTHDWAFCRWLTESVGVAAIPPSAFYDPAHKALAASLARFAFCKRDEVIAEAAARLARLAPGAP
jgi:N-succinyldiaminopimelate aminotransferase